jgi:hypothetical protein
MKMVQITPGCKVIYTDTDSIIYLSPRGKNPIPEGSFLGEMSREYPDYEITEVVCAGPKQYAIKLQHKVKEGEIKYVIKCRGITLNEENRAKLTFEKFKELVFKAYKEEGGEQEEAEEDNEFGNPVFAYNRLGPDKESRVFTRKMLKIYRCINTKGYANGGTIFPFGYE